MNLELSELGKKSAYISQYDKSLLFPIPRSIKREELGIFGKPEFSGCDIWTSFEISWLNPKGKPVVKIARFDISCHSVNIIESKSFKLYLNSFNNTKFEDEHNVMKRMTEDLSAAAKGEVKVRLFDLKDYDQRFQNSFDGLSLDDLDVEISDYETNTRYLSADEQELVEETLTSDLLKSNCLVTGQPDWGSVMIHYYGGKLNREGLLKYLISFRNHDEFHEQCVERIFNDIMKQCKPVKLMVYARYTRRGGLDINPMRYNFDYDGRLDNVRLARQ
ncbi:MAG: NADPH-dependent 7-cyano-7-deazaguanine reductase QueF [Francisellaceae bacterium]